MANIAIDVDDTLYDFGRLAREILSEQALYCTDVDLQRQLQAAAYSPWTEWRTPADLLPIEVWINIIKRCHEDDVIFQQALFPGCRTVLWKLIECGHSITYISNRAVPTYGATAGWIERCDLPHATGYDGEGNTLNGRVTLICTSEPKIPLLIDCQYMIDDRPRTLIEFLADRHWVPGERKAFGLHRSYNSSLTDVTGVYLAPSWYLLDHYLTAKGVIDPAATSIGYGTEPVRNP